MEIFLENFREALENGLYEELIRFEQSRLKKFGILHQFEIGETIDMIYDGIDSGEITYKPEINFAAFMKMQIRSMISKRIKRRVNNFDGYHDEETLNNFRTQNGELTEAEVKYIEQTYDLNKLEELCFEKILADDEPAAICLLEYTNGKKVKEIAEYIGSTEEEAYSSLRRARYKLEKYLPEEFNSIKRK